MFDLKKNSYNIFLKNICLNFKVKFIYWIKFNKINFSKKFILLNLSLNYFKNLNLKQFLQLNNSLKFLQEIKILNLFLKQFLKKSFL